MLHTFMPQDVRAAFQLAADSRRMNERIASHCTRTHPTYPCIISRDRPFSNFFIPSSFATAGAKPFGSSAHCVDVALFDVFLGLMEGGLLSTGSKGRFAGWRYRMIGGSRRAWLGLTYIRRPLADLCTTVAEWVTCMVASLWTLNWSLS